MIRALVLQTKPAALLTLAEAAKIAGRSYSWARTRAIDGRLDERRCGADRSCSRASTRDVFGLLDERRSGPVYVTAESLARVIEAERKTAKGRTQHPRRAHLRLVVNNDKA